jgi:hypothetical protein
VDTCTGRACRLGDAGLDSRASPPNTAALGDWARLFSVCTGLTSLNRVSLEPKGPARSLRCGILSAMFTLGRYVPGAGLVFLNGVKNLYGRT